MTTAAATIGGSATAWIHPPSAASPRTRSTDAQRISSSSSTALWMSKNTDRARMERLLEDSMGNDWRLFRAKLVAQEQAELSLQQELKNKKQKREDAVAAKEERATVAAPTAAAKRQRTAETPDEELAKNGQLGDLFGAAISTIFQKNSDKKKANDGDSDHDSAIKQSKMHSQTPFPTRKGFLPQVRRARNAADNKIISSRSNIFDGTSIGGIQLNAGDGDSLTVNDPFMSADELPIHVDVVPSIQINKHRWAHPIGHIEPGSVLLANEKLGGVFHQTVVLIVDHHESKGTTGIIINRPLEGDLRQVATAKESNLDLSLKLAFTKSPVTYGGPVLPEDFAILHGFAEVEGSKKLAPGIFIGGSEELMQQVRISRFDPHQALFVKGHAAWVPNQLEREIQKGVWYTASVSPDFLLRYAGAPVTEEDDENDLWADILSAMGDDYAKIAAQHTGRGDRRKQP
eukprot:CAMPEP_0119570756 /NCGR_PEP_ID=MMETSP1352-20130426/43773_1 /TAXON_ID=265584 /ORGANISM="Stauroneis constricta, Strain CCMP1120" /LENGTH=458 /DNA_ID=CAMNT_0007620429 /DNA_START=537 /DNA_END=1913 /DNA_ORIENTATION=-